MDKLGSIFLVIPPLLMQIFLAYINIIKTEFVSPQIFVQHHPDLSVNQHSPSHLSE